MQKLSVIICTYNPRDDAFEKCLHSISRAGKYYQPYEIILIDNNSTQPILHRKYVKEFLQDNSIARVVCEERQGLTAARLRAIAESKGDLLIFVDDDNWIKHDFFLQGITIAASYSTIGAWSGQVKLEFEKEPEPWTKPYWGLLVHREFHSDVWSNLPNLVDTMPCGAGLFVRRNVAEHYFQLHKSTKRQIELDRIGDALLSAGDNDLAACACDVGLGVGLFHQLELIHYIPGKRMARSYLLQLAENVAASAVIFRAFRNELPEKMTIQKTIANFLRLYLKRPVDRSFYRATLRGEEKGRNMILHYINSTIE